MKAVILIYCAMLSLSQTLSGQEEFSKVLDLYDRSSDLVLNFEREEDALFLGIGNRCNNNTVDCAAIAALNLLGDTLWTKRIKWLDPGARSFAKRGDSLLLAGHNPPFYDQFYLQINSALTGDSLTTYDLKAPANYIGLNIGGVLTYNAYNIVYGACRQVDSETAVGLAFWVTNEGVVDSLMVFENADLLNNIFQITIDPNGYLTFLIEIAENTPEPNSFVARRKQFMKFDQHMELVWQWTSPLEDKLANRMPSRILALSNGTLVTAAVPDLFFYPEIWAIGSSGFQWKFSLPNNPWYGYTINALIEAANGDILGCGTIEAVDFPLPGSGPYGYLFRLSPNGDLIWDRVIAEDNNQDFGSYGNGHFRDLVELEDGSIFLGGRQIIWYNDENNEPKSNWDLWFVRTDANGCLLDTCDFYQNLTTSVLEPLPSNEIMVFPNPTQDILNFQYPSDMLISVLELFDFMGKRLISQNVLDLSTSLNLTEYSKGIYLLVLTNADGRQFVQKVMRL